MLLMPFIATRIMTMQAKRGMNWFIQAPALENCAEISAKLVCSSRSTKGGA